MRSLQHFQIEMLINKHSYASTVFWKMSLRLDAIMLSENITSMMAIFQTLTNEQEIWISSSYENEIVIRIIYPKYTYILHLELLSPSAINCDWTVIDAVDYCCYLTRRQIQQQQMAQDTLSHYQTYSNIPLFISFLVFWWTFIQGWRFNLLQW